MASMRLPLKISSTGSPRKSLNSLNGYSKLDLADLKSTFDLLEVNFPSIIQGCHMAGGVEGGKIFSLERNVTEASLSPGRDLPDFFCISSSYPRPTITI